MPDDISNRRAEEVLSGIDLGDWSVLIQDTADDLEGVYSSGLSEGLQLTNVGVSVEQVNERALTWAKERAAEMVTLIEDNTRDLIRNTVATAIEEGWSAAKLAEELGQSPGFSRDRAETIARTEIISANNAGALDGYKEARDQGVKVMKEWLTAGDDLVSEGCQENEDEGPIDLDEDFPSGDDAPPAHSNCRCSVVPYLTDEEG